MGFEPELLLSVNEWVSAIYLMLAVSIVVQLALFICIAFRNIRREQLNNLKRRLEAYSLLKPSIEVQKSTWVESQRLSPQAHEELLGTLKKVEQKSASLSAIIVFSLTISLGTLLASGLFTYIDLILVTFCAFLVFPLAGSFLGMRQLDQRRFEGFLHKITVSVPQKLQEDLMEDLLRKEKAFRVSIVWLAVTIFLTIFCIVGASFFFVDLQLGGRFGEFPIGFEWDDDPETLPERQPE